MKDERHRTASQERPDAERSLPGRPEIELIHPTRGLEGYPGVFMPDIDQDRAGVRHWRPRARLFLALFIGLFIAQALGAVVVNLVVDPRSEFGTDVFVPVVLNDVRLKTELLEQRAPPELLILGSSRSITAAPFAADGSKERAFNFAVSHGNLAEQHLIYELVADRFGVPEMVVVGMELERLWGHEEARSHVLNSPAGAYRDPPPDLFDDVTALADTYDWRYLRDTAASFVYTVIGHPESVYAFEPDGVRRYRPFEDPALQATYDRDAAIDLSARQLAARTHRLQDAAAQGLPRLEQLVAAMRGDGVDVHLVFTPFHPRVLAAVEDLGHPALLETARAQVRALCGPGVHVYDFSTIEAFGGDPDDFYDGWHFVGETATAFTRAVHEGRADLCA